MVDRAAIAARTSAELLSAGRDLADLCHIPAGLAQRYVDATWGAAMILLYDATLPGPEWAAARDLAAILRGES